MNVLVTGANGQLGNEIRILSSNCDDSFIFSDVVDASEDSISILNRLAGGNISTKTQYLDITKLDEIKSIVRQKKIEVIINCAAYTNVDAAEDHQNQADILNSKAPEYLAIAMKEANGLLIHISTDYVFGGSNNTPYTEDQVCFPIGVYGRSKLLGEQAIQRIGGNYVIIRTSWLYSEFGKNFVKTMLFLTKTKPLLKVVFDQVGTPTYALDLARAIMLILKDYKQSVLTNPHNSIFSSDQILSRYSKCGIYHFSNEGVCSWFDFAKMIATYVGNIRCDIQPCHSNEFPSKVIRPSYSVLDKSRIKRVFGISIPFWADSLEHNLDNLGNKVK